MDKRDIAILGTLILLLVMWPMVGPQIEEKFFPKPDVPTPSGEAVEPGAPDDGPPAGLEPGMTIEPALTEGDPSAATEPEPVLPETEPEPEVQSVLSNEVVRVTVSSYGAGVVSVELLDYRERLEADSANVLVEMAPNRALAYVGVPGLERDRAFRLETVVPGQEVRLERVTGAGLKLVRHVRIADGYLLEVEDTFSQAGDSGVLLGEPGVELGMVTREASEAKDRYGMYSVSVDALLQGGKGVQHFGKPLANHVRKSGELESSFRLGEPIDWAAVKNRYFAQILTPEGGGEDLQLFGRRADAEAKQLDASSATVILPSLAVEPGQSEVRRLAYYVGPKKYSVLSAYGRHQVDVMQFGRFAPICKFLLWVLNQIHDKLWPHNYGLAIMLLTIIIRVLFWPITHRGTESMRRMQEIQPQLKELREKFKDTPEKQQKAMMELYKEHKINPLGGCLPMVIQIPVFYALFVVLRSAIELRYASFLWIRDLSVPEGLFAGLLPFGLELNILPLVMTVTMVWQQKLTPTSGDPRQAKMMQIMPIFMLVLFYNFAAGLVLYWTTNQCLMILQQYFYKKRRDAKAVADG